MQSGIDDDADMDGLSDDCAPLEARKQRRKHRNRLSAAASRQRKKEWVDALQDQLKLLAAENAALKQRLQSFAGESSCSTSSGGFDMDSARLPPTESNRCKATAAAKAGAAAGLLAFRAVAAAPAADAIASDLVLGARLRAHRIEDIVQIMMASEHLAAAAAAAASGLPPTAALSVKSETASESSAANSPSSRSAASCPAVFPAKRCVAHQAHLSLHPLCGLRSRPPDQSAAPSCPAFKSASAADALRPSTCAASIASLVPTSQPVAIPTHGLGDALVIRLGDDGAKEARLARPSAVDEPIGCGASEALPHAGLARTASEQPCGTRAERRAAPSEPPIEEESALVASDELGCAAGGRDAAALPLTRISAPAPSASIDGGYLTRPCEADASTHFSGSPAAKRARRPSRLAKDAAAIAAAVAEAATEAVAGAATEAVAEAATEAVAEAGTEAATEAVAEVVAEAATEAATEVVAEVVAEAATEEPLASQRYDQSDVTDCVGTGVAPVSAEVAASVAPAAAASASSGGASGPLEYLVRALRTLHEAPAPPMKLGGACRMAKVQ